MKSTNSIGDWYSFTDTDQIHSQTIQTAWAFVPENKKKQNGVTMACHWYSAVSSGNTKVSSLLVLGGMCRRWEKGGGGVGGDTDNGAGKAKWQKVSTYTNTNTSPHTQIQIRVHIHKYKYESTYTCTNTSPHTQIHIQIGAIVITERARPNVHTLHLRYSKYGKYITVIVMHDVNQHKMPTVFRECDLATTSTRHMCSS